MRLLIPYWSLLEWRLLVMSRSSIPVACHGSQGCLKLRLNNCHDITCFFLCLRLRGPGVGFLCSFSHGCFILDLTGLQTILNLLPNNDQVWETWGGASDHLVKIRPLKVFMNISTSSLSKRGGWTREAKYLHRWAYSLNYSSNFWVRLWSRVWLGAMSELYW